MILVSSSVISCYFVVPGSQELMKIAEAVNQAADILNAAAIQEPRREAVSLLELAIGRDRTFIFAYPDYKLIQKETDVLESLIGQFLFNKAAEAGSPTAPSPPAPPAGVKK